MAKATPARKQAANRSAVSLNCYTIRFNKKNIGGDLTLSEVFGSDDFKKIMDNIFKTYSALAFSSKDNKTMSYMVRKLTSTDTIFSGIIKKGQNGQETDIDELDKGKPNTVNSIKAEQYSSSHFYFMFAIPKKNADHIFFIAQSFGLYGFKEIFAESFRDYIEKTYSGQFSCKFNNVTIPKLIDEYFKNGDVRTLKIKKHSLDSNYENLLEKKERINTKDFEIEISIKAKKKGFTRFKNLNLAQSIYAEVLGAAGDAYDEVYADISYNKRMRSINISNPEKFIAAFDVTADTEFDTKTGRPIFNKLDLVAINIVKTELLGL